MENTVIHLVWAGLDEKPSNFTAYPAFASNGASMVMAANG